MKFNKDTKLSGVQPSYNHQPKYPNSLCPNQLYHLWVTKGLSFMKLFLHKWGADQLSVALHSDSGDIMSFVSIFGFLQTTKGEVWAKQKETANEMPMRM